MTTEQQPDERLELDVQMDVGDALKQVGKIANSTSDVILKYVMIGVFCLFGFLVYFQWRQNSSSPERLISIMEDSVKANTDSLKVQERSLEKIQEFSIQVPMEHANAAQKIEANGVVLNQMRTEQSELRIAIKANSEAVQKNTEAVAKLIGAIEQKIGVGSDPNAQTP